MVEHNKSFFSTARERLVGKAQNTAQHSFEGFGGRAEGTSRASMTLCDRQQGGGILIGSALCVYSKLDIRTPHST